MSKLVPRKFMYQASGFNADGSKIEAEAIPNMQSMIEGVQQQDEVQPPPEILVSQRKLFRVKKWKKTGEESNDEYVKRKWRDEQLKKLDEHDYILLTDSESFKKENIEILEGIHHLTKIVEPPVYDI
jgi:hypothetical protein